jgi:8-amino-7-oxononanoate synthase
VIDLTSSLYLGLEHPSGALRPWRALTLGRPAVLGADALTQSLEARLAGLLGTEAAALGRSTTHLFVDLSTLAGRGSPLLLDLASYPALRWGAERAAGTGRPVAGFERGDLRALAGALRAKPAGGLVLTDGLCCNCGTPAPIGDYAAIARQHGASVVIDDTQAVGILGARPRPGVPWGSGGGGTARWLGLAGAPGLIVVASLAKALGAPLATIAGTAQIVERWRSTSETRVHSSPPASAELAALERALAANRRHGDRLRSRLLENIRQFRQILRAAGVAPGGGLFPIQSVTVRSPALAREYERRLRRAGVLGVIQRAPGGRARLSFVLTTAHEVSEIARAAALIGRYAPERSDPLACARCTVPIAARSVA